MIHASGESASSDYAQEEKIVVLIVEPIAETAHTRHTTARWILALRKYFGCRAVRRESPGAATAARAA
jgi:hypothetical protein